MNDLLKQDRIKKFGEVFTPTFLAQEMIDKIPEAVWSDPSKTLLEPSCGDGVFVYLSIKKRLALGVPLIDAIKNTFAIDIMDDNIRECRLNVFAIIMDYFKVRFENKQLTREEVRSQTILCTAILFHNVRVTKDTLSENFSEWKTFDEESEVVKRNFLKMAEKSIPLAIKKLEDRETGKQTHETINTKEPVKQLDFPEMKEVAEKTKRVVRKEPTRPQPQPIKPFVSQENFF